MSTSTPTRYYLLDGPRARMVVNRISYGQPDAVQVAFDDGNIEVYAITSLWPLGQTPHPFRIPVDIQPSALPLHLYGLAPLGRTVEWRTARDTPRRDLIRVVFQDGSDITVPRNLCFPFEWSLELELDCQDPGLLERLKGMKAGRLLPQDVLGVYREL